MNRVFYLGPCGLMAEQLWWPWWCPTDWPLRPVCRCPWRWTPLLQTLTRQRCSPQPTDLRGSHRGLSLWMSTRILMTGVDVAVTSFRVLQVVFDILHSLLHLLLAAYIQLDHLHAIWMQLLQLLCTLSTFILQGCRDDRTSQCHQLMSTLHIIKGLKLKLMQSIHQSCKKFHIKWCCLSGSDPASYGLFRKRSFGQDLSYLQCTQCRF